LRGQFGAVIADAGEPDLNSEKLSQGGSAGSNPAGATEEVAGRGLVTAMWWPGLDHFH
jgi:hypothetical protein